MPEPNFANRTVWTGDNLDVLRGINTGERGPHLLGPAVQLQPRPTPRPSARRPPGAAFKDTWTLDDVDEAWHGEIADRRPGAVRGDRCRRAGARQAGMKSYLIMMAVRLLEMRRVLKRRRARSTSTVTPRPMPLPPDSSWMPYSRRRTSATKISVEAYFEPQG